MSAIDPPLFLRLTNELCPGVSMTRRPGISMWTPSSVNTGPQISFSVSGGKWLAPMC